MNLQQAKETLEEIGIADDITPELVEASGIVLDRLSELENDLEDKAKRRRWVEVDPAVMQEQAMPQPAPVPDGWRYVNLEAARGLGQTVGQPLATATAQPSGNTVVRQWNAAEERWEPALAAIQAAMWPPVFFDDDVTSDADDDLIDDDDF